MTRRLGHTAALLGTVALFAAAVPVASAATTHSTTTTPNAVAAPRPPATASAKSRVGTVKGKIHAAHRLKTVDIVIYERKTAKDGGKGWVVRDDGTLANGGYGVTLNKKTGAYSFTVRPGTYRLEFNGAYGSGHSWGIVGYGPGKPAAAAFGKSIKVRRGKATQHINVKAAGNFGNLKLPDPSSSMSPTEPTPGGKESAVVGTWPHGTVWTYTWQIGDSRKFLSFKPSVTVPSGTAGESIGLVVYGHVYGKNGSAVSIGTGVAQ
jgi:hypothetical protein